MMKIVLPGIIAALVCSTISAPAAEAAETTPDVCVGLYNLDRVQPATETTPSEIAFQRVLRFAVAEKSYPNVKAAETAANASMMRINQERMADTMSVDDVKAHFVNCMRRYNVRPDGRLRMAERLGYSPEQWQAYWDKPENFNPEEKAARAQKAQLAAQEQKAAQSAKNTKPTKFDRGIISGSTYSWDPGDLNSKDSTHNEAKWNYLTAHCPALYGFLAGPNWASDPQYLMLHKIIFSKAEKDPSAVIGSYFKYGEETDAYFRKKYGKWKPVGQVSEEEAFSRDSQIVGMLQRKAAGQTFPLAKVRFGESTDSGYGEMTSKGLSEYLIKCYLSSAVTPPANAFNTSFTDKDFVAAAIAYGDADKSQSAKFRELQRYREEYAKTHAGEWERKQREQEAEKQAIYERNRANAGVGQPASTNPYGTVEQQCAAEWARLEEHRKAAKAGGNMPTTEYFQRLQRYSQICK